MCVPIKRWGLAIATALAGTALQAGEIAPLLQPQWIATMSEDALVVDRIAASSDPATLRLADGGALALTVNDREILLRRYAADGSVLRVQSTAVSDDRFDVVLRATAANDAFYVLAGGLQGDAMLIRFDRDLQRTWSAVLPAESSCQRESACLRLELLDDGSAVAMRAFRVMRVGSDGEIRWSFADPDAPNGFLAGDLAVDRSAIWFATSGGTELYDPTATLSRIDLDGVRLSADESSCHGCGGVALADIDLIDGGAHVVGNGGGRGFFAAYDGLGHRLSWISSDRLDDYRRIDHDAAGAIYVLAGQDFEQVVDRIDPVSGATLWSVAADDFVARASGVATIRASSSAIEASAIDGSGTTVWTQSLTASNGAAQQVSSRPALIDGDVELLVTDLAPSDDPCAIYPVLVRLDASGGLLRYPAPCRAVETAAMVWDIDARPGTGALVNTLARLALYSPNGDLRWRLDACLWCTAFGGASQWAAGALAIDGGAWAVRWNRPSLASPEGDTSIQRLDALGDTVFDVPSAGSAAGSTSGYVEVRLLAGAHDVVLLRGAFAHGLTWQRVGDDGADLGVRAHAIPDDDYRIEDARRLPDGGTSVLVKGKGYCTVGCPPLYITVLRLAADGTQVWRYQFPEPYAPQISVALRDDGGAVAVLPLSGDGNERLSMRVIDESGNAGSDIVLNDIDPLVRPEFLARALDGRWLLTTYPYGGSEDALWLLDSDGRAVTVRRNAPYLQFLGAGTPGYLVAGLSGPETESILLLDPHTLADRAGLYNGTGSISGPRPWRQLADGTVYGTLTRPYSRYQAIARYSVPGGELSDVIFRDGLD